MCIVCGRALSDLEAAIFALWFILLVWLTVSGVRKDRREMPLWRKIVYHSLAVGVDSPGGTIASAAKANGRILLHILKAVTLIALIIYGLGAALVYIIR